VVQELQVKETLAVMVMKLATLLLVVVGEPEVLEEMLHQIRVTVQTQQLVVQD
jgi:hypothetical protein